VSGRSIIIIMLCAVLPAGACDPRAVDLPIAEELTFSDERRVDLTGDGQPERIVVHASGPAHDSLHVRLDVLNEQDSVLFREAWSSRDYFLYDPLAELPDTTVQRMVRGYLTELLRDTAFAPPAVAAGNVDPAGMMPDPEAVRYDIAAYSWRRNAGLPDTLPVPIDAHDEIRAFVVADAAVEQLVAELAQRPSFTFYAGGETTYTIAWSDRERRFIRIRSCC
jgi:hypothetical protein